MTNQITTAAEAAAVPFGHVVLSAAGTIAARFDDERGVVFGGARPFPWTDLALPLTVLWPIPEQPAAVVAEHELDALGASATLAASAKAAAAPLYVVALVDLHLAVDDYLLAMKPR